jgi:superfamily II DNA or RNA helicase
MATIEDITFVQKSKVDELLSLVSTIQDKIYCLCAPTGSGKTYMQGYLMNELLKKHPDAKIVYQTLSKAGLPKQSYDSIVGNFGNEFNNINATLLSTDHTNQESLIIPLDYNVYFLPKQLNIKGGNLETPLKDFLTYKTSTIPKFLIIDEFHEDSKNIMKFKDEFDYIFGFTATPTAKQKAELLNHIVT